MRAMLSSDLVPLSKRQYAWDFSRLVHEALVHLHDVSYLQNHPLPLDREDTRTIPTRNRGRAEQKKLLDAIESLRPSDAAPARAGRAYRVLMLRYVEGLEIAEIQDRLGIGPSEYFRCHRRALEAAESVLADCRPIDFG